MKGRRQFLRDAMDLPPLIAALFAAPLMVSCGDDGGGTGSYPPPATGGNGGGTGKSGAIGLNHGHSVSITQVQLDTPTDLTLTFSAVPHTHTLSLTAQQVQDIAAGIQVQEISSFINIHDHLVTFN